MEERELLKLLREVQAGTAAPEEAARLLSRSTFEDLGYAKVDHHRASRQGAAEVIFGQGKEPDQIEGIVRSMAERGAGNILITRLSGEKEEKLRGRFPYRYSAEARLAVANNSIVELRGDLAQLQDENRVLQARYELLFDVEEIERQFLSDGSMVRSSPGQTVYLDLSGGDSVVYYEGAGSGLSALLQRAEQFFAGLLS